MPISRLDVLSKGCAIASLLLVVGSWSCSSSGTAIVVDLHYETSWRLDHLGVAVSNKTATTDMAPSVRVLVPDDWAGQSQTVEVFGIKGTEKWAHGKENVTPVRGQETHVVVVLARLPCGAWCTAGAMTCMGAATASCVTRADGCLAWGTPMACPSNAAQCSQGVCSSQCIPECATGETRCDGPSAVRSCGEADDGDACLDWLPSVPCPSGQVCSNGRCSTQCQNECQLGAALCLGGGTITCGDLNADGCFEWGPVKPCATGMSCSNGQCSATCQDECTASACAGLSYASCGQFDFDSCMDLSPGVSCVPADPCIEGMCTAQGCSTVPKVCNNPPLPTCIDGTHLRTFAGSGTCSAGTCNYPSSDTTCSGGCMYGTCAGQRIWVFETVDSGVAVVPSLRASGNTLHIAYFSQDTSGTRYSIRYAYRGSSSQSWHAEVVDPDVLPSIASMAVDGSQGVHIVYRETTGLIEHAYRATSASMWSFDDIENGIQPSIEMSGSGEIHVAYTSPYGVSGFVKYAHRAASGSTWGIETVDTSGQQTIGPELPSVQLLGTGVAIAYSFGSPDFDLKYAAHAGPGSPWSSETVEAAGDVGSGTLRIDSLGGRHIVYFDQSNGDLRYAYRGTSDPSWHLETVDKIGSGGSAIGTAIDNAGGIYISYIGATNQGLKYAFKPLAGPWTIQALDISGYVSNPSLAVDAAGGLHIAYCDCLIDNLRLRHGYLPP